MAWNFRTGAMMPKLDTRTANEIGGEVGSNFGAIGNFASDAFKGTKANDLIAKFNNPNDTTIFGGLKGSARAEKLSQLLMPLDRTTAERYKIQADNEKKAETISNENQAVVTARSAVHSVDESGKPVDAEAMDAKRLRAGAEARMGSNPEQGIEWLRKASELEQKKLKAENDIDKARKTFEVGSPQYVEFLFKRKSDLLNTMKYDVNLDADAKQDLAIRMGNIDSEIAKYPFGKMSLGIKDNETQVDDIKKLTLDQFLAINKPILAADGSYSNLDVLNRNLKDWVKENGQSNAITDELSAQLGSASEQNKSNKSASFETAQKVADAKLTQKRLMDSKYPTFASAVIPLANKLSNFIRQGDTGNIGDRNNAIKSLSRAGSDEALTETDFGRQLGRSIPTQMWSSLLSKIGANQPITDEEWKQARASALYIINTIKNKREEINKEFPNQLDKVNVYSAPTEKATAKTANRRKATAEDF